MSKNSELVEKYQSGDEKAADELVENNMGLVYSIVRRFSNVNCESEDLVQIGAIGLIKAVRRFDSSFDVKFSTYAVPVIIGEIKRFLRDDGAIKVSRSIKETAIKGRRAEEILRKKLGRDVGINEIAKEIGVDETELVQAFEASVMPESLYAKVNIGGKGDSDGVRLLDFVADNDTEEKITDRVFLRQSLELLSERERKIIVLRYFKGKTQCEISGLIGVSQVQVSRLEKKAIEKMRSLL